MQYGPKKASLCAGLYVYAIWQLLRQLLDR